MTPPDRMRELLAEPGLIVMPGVWDGVSAKLTTDAGFQTAFLSGSCVAASRLGGPDLDLVSFAEMLGSLELARDAAPDLLILGDGDHGYGNAMNVQRTVRAYGRAGAAAVLIEDKETPRPLTSAGKSYIPREDMRMKIRAAIEAAKDSGILVLARTVCRPAAGIDEAMARIEMYVEEGADIVFFDGAVDRDEVERGVRTAQGVPVFSALAPGYGMMPTQEEAAEWGIKIAAYPTALMSPAMAGMKAGLAGLAAADDAAIEGLSAAEYAESLGYSAYDVAAKRYVAAD